MSFESFGDFIAMGKHGPYVWSAYGIALLVLALNVILPLRAQKRVLAAQARQMRREAAVEQVAERADNASGS